jgi:accessory gene regulator B
METLARNIAEKITLELNYDENKKAVIAYGLTAIFQMITIFALISIIGVTFDFWYESIIIFLGVGIIRKSTGGAHSLTMYGCIVISILSITVLSALSRYLLGFPVNTAVNFSISFLVYIVCFHVFYHRVPVDSPNKPIAKGEKIKRLRRQSFLILTIFFFLSIATIILSTQHNRFYSIAVSIRLTMLWQLFTLTEIGGRFFNKVDSRFNGIIGKE